MMGAGGVGKTRLAREIFERFSLTRENAVIWVCGTRSAGAVPCGAFAHLLPALDARGLDRLVVMMLARRAVLELASKDALLVVDDAHLLDDASAALVHQLVMARAMHVMATVRSGERAPDALVALWKDSWLECLDVQPLDRVALGASSLDATLVVRVAGLRAQRFAEGRRTRELRVHTRRGRTPLTLRLSLSAGGLSRGTTVSMSRPAR